MEIQNKFNNTINKPTLNSVIKFANSSLAEDLNCMKIGIVDSVYDDMTVSVKLANKKTIKTKHNGTQEVREYALIRAKVCYCTPFATWDIKKGDECVLLFSDKEIESWFITGEVQPIAYPRQHDLTDAVAIFGIRSLPKVIEVINGLHLFYGGSDLKLENNKITLTSTTFDVNGLTNITGNTSITGNLNVSTGASGTFTSVSGKHITVTKGIVTSITQ